MELIAPSQDINSSVPFNFAVVDLNQQTELFQEYSQGLLNFASISCIIFILVGVPGNLITIIALARCKKVRNATAVFIINLSLSDLLFCCFNLPLAASTFWNRSWTHGDLLCRLYPLLRYGLLAVSLFTVLAITINRYVMIGHPRIYPRIYRRRFLGMMVASTWICAFCALIPTWRGVWGQFGLDVTVGSCSILRDANQSSPKEFLFLIAFVLPCLSIVICYARIFYIVRKTAIRIQDPITKSFVGSIKMSHPHNKPETTKQMNQLNEKCGRAEVNNTNDVCQNNLLDKCNDNHHNLQVNLSNDADNDVNENINGNNIKCNREEKEIIINELNSKKSNLFTPNKYLSKTPNDELKFIDTSVDSDLPPTLSSLKNNNVKIVLDSSLNLINCNSSRNVEFSKDDDIEIKNVTQKQNVNVMQNYETHEVDSAVDDSSSSSVNNQIYQIQNEKPNNNNQLLSFQIEPSSSSGIDLPYDHESPQRADKKSFVTALRHSTRIRRRRTNESRKKSVLNTSGASIMYPGRMTSKDRRLLKMILVIFVSFLICYLPITITKVFRAVTNIHFLNIMSYLLIYLTTCINPIIYVVMSSEYRQAYWNLLMCRTNNSCSNNEIIYKNSQRT